MKFYKQNSDSFRQIDSATYNRVQKHLNNDCICCISAFSPHYDETSKRKNLEICKQKNLELANDILGHLHNTFIKLQGHYTYKIKNKSVPFDEESYMVICTNFLLAAEEGDEAWMREEAETFKKDMDGLREEYKQDSILLRYYVGDGKFKTELRYSDGRTESLSNNMTEEGLSNLWSTVRHKQFYLPYGDDNTQVKLASMSFDFTFENWKEGDPMSREYNWKEFLFRRKLREHLKKD